MNIKFPFKKDQRYYDLHYKYILNILLYDKNNVITFTDETPISNTAFICYMNNNKVIFDFSDSSDLCINTTIYPIFKFHYEYNKNYTKNVYPITPISFYNWSEFFINSKQIIYNHKNTVLHNQRSYGNAIERRNLVKNILQNSIYSNIIDTTITNQQQYWNKINIALVSICVPGFCNNMLDRGQLQYIGFGCPTISPYIPEIFSYTSCLIPDVHYIKCNNDYSDILEKIDWCIHHTQKCIQIGDNAKEWFNNTSTPDKLNNWIYNVVNEFYK
jgi:hypothetical protein